MDVRSAEASCQFCAVLNGRRSAVIQRRRSFLGSHSVHNLQQRAQFGSFFVESVRCKPGRDVIEGKGTAHGNNPDGGKPATNSKPDIRGMFKVGERDVRDFLPNLEQCGRAVLSRSHTMPELRKEVRSDSQTDSSSST